MSKTLNSKPELSFEQKMNLLEKANSLFSFKNKELSLDSEPTEKKSIPVIYKKKRRI